MKKFPWAAVLVLTLAPLMLKADASVLGLSPSAAVSPLDLSPVAVPLTVSAVAVPLTASAVAVPLTASAVAVPLAVSAVAVPLTASAVASPYIMSPEEAAAMPKDSPQAAVSQDSIPGHRHAPEREAPLDPSLWSQHGLEYRFSLGVLKLPNGQALSYDPLEMGWRFADGWRLRLGVEVFSYTGLDSDTTTIASGYGPQTFYYEMEDFRLSALYVWPWASRLRPLAGVTIESVFGNRQIAAPNANFYTTSLSPPVESAHGFEAPGVELGLEYRGGPSWAISLEARYVAGIGYWSNLAGTDFGWHYLF